ncbi:MAG: CHAP domain-containing protein [Oscillospiraceae bacterium]|nr:CHAP domain-containing protein [Oscillospiraceae bacterium]
MKFIKRAFMVLVICIALVPNLCFAHAAYNPYPKSQTINDVTTVPCTYFAWSEAYKNMGVELPMLGDAKGWYYGAKNLGYHVGPTVRENSIAVWDGATYGHVAYVTSYYEDPDNNAQYMVISHGGISYEGKPYAGTGIKRNDVRRAEVGSKTARGDTLLGYIYLDEPQSKLLASAEQVKPLYASCKHKFTEWVIVVDGECNEEGYKQRYCTKCRGYERELIDGTSHKFKKFTEFAYEGEEVVLNECEVCGTIVVGSIEEHEHRFTSWEVKRIPTMFEDGYSIRYCTYPDCNSAELLTMDATGIYPALFLIPIECIVCAILMWRFILWSKNNSSEFF